MEHAADVLPGRWPAPTGTAVPGESRPEVFCRPDGVRVAFRRYGPVGGRPVLVHHGLIGSDRVPAAWARLAHAYDVELIAVARPGYGASTPVDLDEVAGWVPHCAPLVDVLGHERLSVLGVGDGIPYALAMAAFLPSRVRRIVSLGPGHPTDTWTAPADAGYLARHLTATRRELPADHPWQRDLRAAEAHDAAGPALTVRLRSRPWGFHRADVHAPVWTVPRTGAPSRLLDVLAAEPPVSVGA